MQKGQQWSQDDSNGDSNVTIRDFRKILQEETDKVGLNEFARRSGASPTSISLFLNGTRDTPPKKALDYLGYEMWLRKGIRKKKKK